MVTRTATYGTLVGYTSPLEIKVAVVAHGEPDEHLPQRWVHVEITLEVGRPNFPKVCLVPDDRV